MRTRGSDIAVARLHRLAVAALILTLVLVPLGAAVRSTGSGLACPDWPFCYGQLIPRQADIPEPSGYTLWNVWLEHTHRLVASAVGGLVIAVAVVAIARRAPRAVLVPAVVSVTAVAGQGALGALVVLRRLRTDLVTAHMGMAMVVIASLVVVVSRASDPVARDGNGPDAGDGRVAVLAAAVAALGFATVLAGAQVTGLGAGGAFGTNPLLFDGALLPAVDTAGEAFHLAHRMLATTLLLAVGLLTVAARRNGRAGRTARRRAIARTAFVLAALVAVQLGLGVANVVLRSPTVVVVAHVAVASWIWTAAVVIAVSPRR